MGEHAAALEAACTAISDLAAALADVRAAALDGDGVRAKNQLEMAGSDLMSALDATGKARWETDLDAPAWRCWRERAGPGARRRPGRGPRRAAISSTGPA